MPMRRRSSVPLLFCAAVLLTCRIVFPPLDQGNAGLQTSAPSAVDAGVFEGFNRSQLEGTPSATGCSSSGAENLWAAENHILGLSDGIGETRYSVNGCEADGVMPFVKYPVSAVSQTH
jgi:hypothetical protein